MHIKDYISHVSHEGKVSSRYDITVEGEELNTLRKELTLRYAAFLCDRERDVGEKFSFLSYHASKFKGDPQLFREFVKWSYKGLWYEGNDPYMLQATRECIKPIAKGWLKRGEVELPKEVAAPDKDPRIKVMRDKSTLISAENIRFWFEGELLSENSRGDQIMGEDDFDLFIRFWFYGTGEIATIPPNRLLRTKATKTYLMNMVKSFFQKYGKNSFNKGLRNRMVEMMPLTFEQFRGDDADSISRNL